MGLYGACSTMALSLILAATAVESGAADKAVAVTSSHFCSSERQFRFPLEYGGQRPQTAQWTVTGSGSVLLSRSLKGVKVNAYTVGKIIDLDITDMNNMGAAMAPGDVKIRPYPTNEGMVFFYTKIQYLGGIYNFFIIHIIQLKLKLFAARQRVWECRQILLSAPLVWGAVCEADGGVVRKGFIKSIFSPSVTAKPCHLPRLREAK